METGSNKGSALVMAIWTIAVLSLLVVSFALDAQLQAKVNLYVRERFRVDHLTEAGTAIAEVLLLDYSSVSDATEDEDLAQKLEDDRWIVEKRAIKRGSTASTGAIPVDALNPDAGTVTINIRPLEAKWNINNLYPGGDANYDKIWESVLTCANVPQEYWEELIDCWSDWRDTDTTVTGNDGAEDEYYEEKQPPYKARNGEIADIKELAMIKGFAEHPAILTGGVLNPDARKEDQVTVKPLSAFFDVYGTGKINVNAASADVLASVPGIDGDEEIVGAITEGRASTVETASSTTFRSSSSTSSSSRSSSSSSSSSRSRSSSSRSSSSSSSSRSRSTSSSLSDEPSAATSRSSSLSSSSRASTTSSSSSSSSSRSSSSSLSGNSSEYGPFKSWADLNSRTSATIQTDANTYLSYTPESYFEVTIIGASMGITHTVRAIAMIKSSKVRYIRWQEDP